MKYLTVGPSGLRKNVPMLIKEALENDVCSISHRSKDFENFFSRTVSAVKILFNVPENYHIFFLGSATECMERIIENCVSKRSFHFVNGAFSKRFFEIALELGKDSKKCEVPFGEGFSFDSATIPDDTEMICFTHNETSTGVMIDLNDVYSIKKKNPEKLVAVDIVSSAPYCDVDFSYVDCAFFSVQKGMGMPAGLGVMIVNDKCIDKAKVVNEKVSIGSYHSLLSLQKKALKNQTPETPNVLGIYLLGKVCEEMNSYGIDRLREETDEKAKMLYEFFSGDSRFSLFVKDEKLRSKTVVVSEVLKGSFPVIEKVKEKGFVIGTGYGKFKEKQIRLANFPQVSKDDVEELISIMEGIEF